MATTIMDLPAEINAMIVSYVGVGRSHPIAIGSFHDPSSKLRCPSLYSYNTELANLRLANKTFSALASPLFFRVLAFCVGIGKVAAFHRFLEICRSQHAIHVRELELKICHCPKDPKNKFDGFSEESKQRFEKEFTTALSRLTNIETLAWVFWCFSSWCSKNQHSILYEAVMRADLPKLKNLKIVVFGLPFYPKIVPELTGASRERVKRLIRQIRCLWIDQAGHSFLDGDGLPSPGHDFTAWFVSALENGVDRDSESSSRDSVSTPRGAMTALQAPSIHLKTLVLESVPVSLHVLKFLTTQARQTIKRVELSIVIAYSCRWRNLLSLLIRLPHLVYMRVNRCIAVKEAGNYAHTQIGTVGGVASENESDDESSEDGPADIKGPDVDLSGDVEVALCNDIAWVPQAFAWVPEAFSEELRQAFARLLRHVDANRSATGMRPLMKEFEYKVRQ
ncbi:uncharacterized protein BO66DRAFT_440298 [Aspergillus aculeatinus CBS 121060]|uniref:Uncharacterized protein n=1 Tax=Aspergillus aculeatinus CBS 121060 TaxID=1448322 RepID=A0ACD1H4A1_9EURO|nr:hypothetical protein BO66DRAFT_440298 [Aspergillus aculeatinus CBS 121060]RAH68374.1 hypothetical protein BO66DRAFT_440298 [Aspergillus aculeatinus CBS 121060]